MDIKNDKELKFIIDKLIEYQSEINDEIKELNKVKKEVEKVIKSYIIKTEEIQKEQPLELHYESEYFNVQLTRKLIGKELKKFKKENIQILLDNEDYKSIEIKPSVQLIKILIDNIENSEYQNEKEKYEQALAKYLNYINRDESNDNKHVIDKQKIDLIRFFIHSKGNEINYIDAKKYVKNTFIASNDNLKESHYKIKLNKKAVVK